MSEPRPQPVEISLIKIGDDVAGKMRGPQAKGRHTSFKSVKTNADVSQVGMSGILFGNIVGQTDRGKRSVTYSLLGQTSDIIYLCASRADAQSLTGTGFVCGLAPFTLTGTDEVWWAAPAGTSVVIGAVIEIDHF